MSRVSDAYNDALLYYATPGVEHPLILLQSRRDMLWFSMDATDEIGLVPQTKLYCKQLDNIKTVFVQEYWWSESSPTIYGSRLLDFLGGLRTIVLLLSPDEPTGDDAETNQRHADHESPKMDNQVCRQ